MDSAFGAFLHFPENENLYNTDVFPSCVMNPTFSLIEYFSLMRLKQALLSSGLRRQCNCSV